MHNKNGLDETFLAASLPVVMPRSCERYDSASNTWSRIADMMPEPLRNYALACLVGSLYAVGGLAEDGTPSTSTPWRYDELENTWVVVPSNGTGLGRDARL